MGLPEEHDDMVLLALAEGAARSMAGPRARGGKGGARLMSRTRAIVSAVYFWGAFACALRLGGWWAAGLTFCALSLMLLEINREARG